MKHTIYALTMFAFSRGPNYSLLFQSNESASVFSAEFAAKSCFYVSFDVFYRLYRLYPLRNCFRCVIIRLSIFSADG